MVGFVFPYKNKDVFVKTDRKNKTDKLAEKILLKMCIPCNPDTKKQLLWYLKKANCEIKTLSNGRKMFDIYGENFGGYGSFIDDGNTIIIEI